MFPAEVQCLRYHEKFPPFLVSITADSKKPYPYEHSLVSPAAAVSPMLPPVHITCIRCIPCKPLPPPVHIFNPCL